MIHEIATIEVAERDATAFEAAVAAAASQFKAAEGCHSLALQRSIEFPTQYRLVVGWETVEAHMDFRETERFRAWRALAGPFFAAPPQVEHVATVVDAF